MLPETAQSVSVSSPARVGGFLFRRMKASESLGRLFKLDLELLSERESIDFEDVVARPMTVRLETSSGDARYFSGHVARFASCGTLGRYARYRAVLRPWLWFLTRSAGCRIFQDQTVPQIIKEVFRDRGFTDVQDSLGADYEKREYCVQYRETDFDFVSRLMEQAGIYYYFQHEEEKLVLVLADSYSSHELIKNCENLPYEAEETAGVVRVQECVFGWGVTRQVQPDACTLNDHDFERPRVDLTVRFAVEDQGRPSGLEVYDYPGAYGSVRDGERNAQTRLEGLHAKHEVVRSHTNARSMAAGGLFKLHDHPVDAQNREYLVLETRIELETSGYETSSTTDTNVTSFECSFTAINSQRPYRTPRTTPTPTMSGPQTAVVVGPAGEEIWTDRYGRVKVQFRWDRRGQFDENSSCWIRVSQAHAGKRFGAIDIPRIGEEVIVEHLEGDPDRPIITGRVYNADAMPPFALPASKNVCGLKSSSLTGGGGYNELSMDDTPGAEKVTIHGQYDMATTVKHDQSTCVQNNRTTKVDVDDALTVGGKQTVSITGDQSVTVGSAQSLSVTGKQTTSVKADQTVTIGGGQTTKITGACNLDAASQTVSVKGAREVTLGGVDKLNVTGSQTLEITGPVKIRSGASITLEVGGSSVKIGPDSITVISSGPITLQGAIIKNNS